MLCSIWKTISHKKLPGWIWILAGAVLLAGCVSPRAIDSKAPRPFNFAKDSLSFSNELAWDYYFDANGKWSHQRHEPKPQYKQHCFVVAHIAKQFFRYADFHPDLAVADEKTYRSIIHEIVFGGDMRPDSTRIIVPGYANLREFSRAQETVLKEEGGGAWRSYFQRGHWRIMGFFSHRHQEKMHEKFINLLEKNQVIVAHLVRFPQLSINHAVLVTGVHSTEGAVEFSIYDPNTADKPHVLTYDRVSRTFSLPSNAYFYGGKVNVYDVYRSCFY